MANSGDRSLANIGWLYAHDAALVTPGAVRHDPPR
jgi:hypothetical protein